MVRLLLGALALALALLRPAAVRGQASVCGHPCQSDVQCPDSRGICTYCTSVKQGACGGAHQHGCTCQAPSATCVGGPTKANTSKPQLLVIGDSISIGWSPVLFPLLPQYESQHVPTNAGPASKGYHCTQRWLGDVHWDVVLVNFGLHSLDRHRLPDGSSVINSTEAETLANYTTEMRSIATQLKQAAKRVIWVDTTPVPLHVTDGPERHNADVITFNAAANAVMTSLEIPTSDVFGAVMDVCPPSSGAPDHTFTSCKLQSPGGVHFPSHYDVLVAAIFKSVTGKPAPPPPPPMTCAQAAAVAGCVGAKGKGVGQACNDCYMQTKAAHPGVFDGPACLANYTHHVPKLAHPQNSFVQCWCFGKSWGGYRCTGATNATAHRSTPLRLKSDDEPQLAAAPAEGNGTAGPGSGPWEVATPESQGLSTASLRAAEEAINNAVGGRVCYLVVKNGKIVAERYRNGWDEDRLHEGFSTTKSHCSSLFGIAREQGWAEPGWKVRDHNNGTRQCNAEAEFLNVLTMTGESRELGNPSFHYDTFGTKCLDTLSDFIAQNNPAGLSAMAWKDRHWAGPLGLNRTRWGTEAMLECGTTSRISCRDLARTAQVRSMTLHAAAPAGFLAPAA